jgi:hypothetical protein
MTAGDKTEYHPPFDEKVPTGFYLCDNPDGITGKYPIAQVFNAGDPAEQRIRFDPNDERGKPLAPTTCSLTPLSLDRALESLRDLEGVSERMAERRRQATSAIEHLIQSK